MENQVIEKTGVGSILQFAPLQSSIDEGFWHRLSSLKLNHWKTDESAVSITGNYIQFAICIIFLEFWRSF